MLRTLSKIRKEAANVEKLDAIKAQHEEYLTSEAYAKWKTEYDAREDDDELRHDRDPEGW
jgi:hypothetical protein